MNEHFACSTSRSITRLYPGRRIEHISICNTRRVSNIPKPTVNRDSDIVFVDIVVIRITMRILHVRRSSILDIIGRRIEQKLIDDTCRDATITTPTTTDNSPDIFVDIVPIRIIKDFQMSDEATPSSPR